MQATKYNATVEQIGGPDRVSAELLTIDEVSQICGCSKRHMVRLADGGKMPRPLRLGRLIRWRRSDITTWIDQGCPNIRSVKGGAR